MRIGAMTLTRRRIWFRGSAAALLTTAVLIVTPVGVAHAGTTITVTTTADETGVAGACSLEDAIQAANTLAPVDACPAGTGNDTIVLASGATYTLDVIGDAAGVSGLPQVTGTMTIEGNGAVIQRDTSSGTPAFRGVVIAGAGSLTVSDVTIRDFDSPGGGGGPGQGGAFYDAGTLTILSSTIADNSAESGGGIDGRGGGIFDAGTLTVVNSTITGNVAVGGGGSVGGALIVRPGSTTAITSSTFANNSGNNGNDMESESSALTITDTIMASGCLMESALTDGGHNLESGSSCDFSGPTDQRGVNPDLGPLGDNGGPTPTMALAPGSPAIDSGGTCPAVDGGTDQRGLPRTASCDTGAYEVQDQAPVLAPIPGSNSMEGTSTRTALATVSDGDVPASSDLSATIGWGDGSQSAGNLVPVTGQPGQFTLYGTHSYADEGSYVQTLSVADNDTGTVSATSTAQVVDAALAGSGGLTLHGTEGPTGLLGSGSDTGPVSGTVATFTDANQSGTVADFTATVMWGDGSTSAGSVTGPAGGPFSVSASHSYAEDGNYPVIVTIIDDGGARATATSTAQVADPPGLLGLLDTLEDLLGG